MKRVTSFKLWDSKKSKMVHNHIEDGWKFAPEKVELTHFNFEWGFLDENKKYITTADARHHKMHK